MSIKTHVLITLDLQSSNYLKWRTLFLFTLGKYGLTHHVDGTKPKHDFREWTQQDFLVLSWLHGSISMEIFNIVMQADATAYTIWTSIENLICDNKKSRVIFLKAEFRNLVQGDMSITDYCGKLKTLADALGDVDQPISDEMLVLTTLHGLNKNYTTMATLLPMQTPFPSFIQACSLLLLEETCLANVAKKTAATFLMSAPSSISYNSNDGCKRGGCGNNSGRSGGGGCGDCSVYRCGRNWSGERGMSRGSSA